MWQIGRFRPVTLFSLRPANATVSGGKTLVTPTPFAIKMGLLDAAIRTLGVEQGVRWWDVLRDLEVAIRLPEYFLVVKTFQRILRPKDKPDDRQGTGLVGPWGGNIVYREYVQYESTDTMQIALRSAKNDLPLEWLMSQINYFGKRGGFFQFIGYEVQNQLDPTFGRLTEASAAFSPDGLMQLLDDCGEQMTFAHANVYDETIRSLKINHPQGRLLRLVVLPYEQIGAGRGYTAYRRLKEA